MVEYDEIAEAIQKQARDFEIYQKFISLEGINAPDIPYIVQDGELPKIPPLPVEYFKKSNNLFHELARISLPGRWNVSSSTGGDPSYVYRTPDDEELMKLAYTDAFLGLPVQDAYLLFSPPPKFLRQISQRFKLDDGKDAILQVAIVLQAAEKYYNLMRPTVTPETINGKLQLHNMGPEEFKSFLDEMFQQERTLAIGPSVILLYPTVLNSLQPGEREFGDKLYVLTGAGGWDGRKGSMRSEPIAKSQFIEDLCERLGIEPTQFMDIYAFTENYAAYKGYWDPEIKDFVYEVPPNIAAYALQDSGNIAPVGERGVFVVYSAKGHEGFAGAAIKQSDTVIPLQYNKDGTLAKFTGISRVKGQDSKGCAYTMSEGVK